MPVKQGFAGADFQAGRNERRIIDEVSAGAVSDDASDGETQEFIAHVFRISDHQANILASQLNRLFGNAQCFHRSVHGFLRT